MMNEPNVPHAASSEPMSPADLEALLLHVETCCNRAAGIVNAAARAVAGDELTLQDDDVPTVFTIALEHVADELEALSDRALRARTGGS